MLSRAGIRLVAVSTIEGALVDPDGLDVDRLLALKAEHGDALAVADVQVEPVEPGDAVRVAEGQAGGVDGAAHAARIRVVRRTVASAATNSPSLRL